MSPILDHLRRQAKTLRTAFNAGDAAARARVSAVLPDTGNLRHADALHVIAREEGHDSWPKLKMAADIARMDREARAERLKIALYFGQGWLVDRLLEADPTLPQHNLGLQIALLDLDAVRARLERDPDAATRIIGVRAPILHLAFSQFWRRDPVLADRSVEMARRLVAHGADVNASFPAEPGSEHELSALYGALGHAGNLTLARWLLENGADPNDNESLYHSTELGHTKGLEMLLAHGAKTDGTNALARAMDFDNVEMVRILLDAGASPNAGIAPHPSGQPFAMVSGLHQAARRMCGADIARLLIAHGADGTGLHCGHTAYALARMRGNHAVARVLEEAGQAPPLAPEEAQLAAIADGETPGPFETARLSPEARRVLHRIVAFPGTLDHARRLVAAGIDPNDVDEQDMPAIHIAGWHGFPEPVEFLLGHAPDFTVENMYGGNLTDTIIHGAEFAPKVTGQDHMRTLQLALAAGAPVNREDIEGCGVEDMAEWLRDWAEDHPAQVARRRPPG